MRIITCSLMRVPLPKEVYRHYSKKYPDGKYTDIRKAANKGFYGTNSIFRAIQEVEKMDEELSKK